MAVVLMVAAGLLTRSLMQLMKVSTGFQPERLATMMVIAPDKKYAENPAVIALAREVVERVSQLPGVVSAGIASDLPITHNGNTTWLKIVGRPWTGDHIETPERDVTPDYFRTIGARLLRGRYFVESEDQTRPPVAIINRAFEKAWFPNGDAVGSRVAYISFDTPPIEIVGVVDDIREGPLDTAIPPVVYLPFNQSPGPYFGLAVRTTTDGSQILAEVAAAIRQIDSEIAIRSASTMAKTINDSESARVHSSSAWLVGGFAALALILSVVGLYGVVASSVSQRTREIGVRMALGAGRGNVCAMVFREAGTMVAAGILAGLVIAGSAGSMIRSLLFGVQTWDAPTLIAVGAILAVAALCASLIPAWRAASVDPTEVLRAE